MNFELQFIARRQIDEPAELIERFCCSEVGQDLSKLSGLLSTNEGFGFGCVTAGRAQLPRVEGNDQRSNPSSRYSGVIRQPGVYPLGTCAEGGMAGRLY